MTLVRLIVASAAFVGVFAMAFVAATMLDVQVCKAIFGRTDAAVPLLAAGVVAVAYVALAWAIAWCAVPPVAGARAIVAAVTLCTAAGLTATIVEDVHAIQVPLATFDFSYREQYLKSPAATAFNGMNENANRDLAITGFAQVVLTWGGAGVITLLRATRRTRIAA